MKQKTDLILKNGAIYTMVCENSVVEALAVHNGKIVYTGTTEEVLAHCEAPQVVDLRGKTVLPGMGDSHLHFFAYCQTHTTVDLGGCTSKAEVIGKLAARAAETPRVSGSRAPILMSPSGTLTTTICPPRRIWIWSALTTR